MENLPNSLKLAASTYDPKATAMVLTVLTNPKLFHTVITMLANKDYVKLCGDGTHKLTYGDWILMALGVLSRVSDYAHVIGACRPGKRKCKHQNVANHRSGLFPMVSQLFTISGKPLLPLIENGVHGLRCVPTALILDFDLEMCFSPHLRAIFHFSSGQGPG